MSRGTQGRGGWTMKGRPLAGLVVGAWLCLALVACSGTATGATPTATSGDVGSGATPGATQSGPTATPFGNGTPGGELGTADICTVTPTPSSASLPSTIPLYAGAQVRIASINGADGVFGLCIADTVQNVDAFYAAQLPQHGWQNVADGSLDTSRQLTANQGSTNLVITISPDAAIPADTQALIIYSGT